VNQLHAIYSSLCELCARDFIYQLDVIKRMGPKVGKA
jgi:hypothetical protein